MSRIYSVLKTTNSISRALDDGSIDRLCQSLIELRDDMREFKVQDEAYSEVLESLEELLEVLDELSDLNTEVESIEIPNNIETQIRIVTHRVDSLYLRNSNFESGDRETADQIKEERDLYRAKLIQSQKVIERYRKALSEELGIERETHDTVKEFIEELQTEAAVEDQIDLQSYKEELGKVAEEQEKMRQQTKEFREKHNLDSSEE